ncbi:hypothetical protein BG011_003167 [Mortierella polycephala]|uniref:Triacylglycerol lipase n=1 Tax=Mortierella polycephala TaxID=41804 RepID=A0A9P6Q1M6_9FUNG|nr:hypothetical protein BG011_003167 [Mortierella polycephala]
MLLKNTLFVITTAIVALTSSLASAGPIPEMRSQAVNDFNCKPTAEHPNPLIMLHGLTVAPNTWSYMSKRFAANGYCAFTLSYGRIPGIPMLVGFNDMMISAQELSDFVDKVLKATGASKVDIIGHSEGSLLPRVYMKYFNGRGKVGSLVGVGSVQYGTTLANITTLVDGLGLGLYELGNGVGGIICKACTQLIAGNPFLNDLNNGGDTYPDIKYIMIVNKYDEIITPYTNGFLRTLGPNVQNVVLQDICKNDISEHMTMPYDRKLNIVMK